MFSKRILFVLGGLGLALCYAWSRIHVVELGYEVSRLKQVVEKIKQENGILQSMLAEALSVNRLLSLAQRRGMNPPESQSIYFAPEPSPREPSE